ncbi:DUF1439 domain-containing protein [Vibrio gallicus]|uniref:DUF1439 domain-containing protein n=1 Tax=Vibrio gallicus TaxID=190897 RepID=UPI0021C4A373|nr:DUF1439 domain-containing protein [Vibrio gallicus]
MTQHIHKLLILFCTSLFLGGCANYSISEQDMTNYLKQNISLEQSVGIKDVLYAQISIDDLKVNIGRVEANRLSVFATTDAVVEMMGHEKHHFNLDIRFSAIPRYDHHSGEIFLESLRLEQLTEKTGHLSSDVKALIQPAVAMIGYGLTDQPIYKLDSNKLEESILKSSNPDLVIKNHKLIIELFN